MTSPRHYLICPDSFKGSLSARQVAEAMRLGVLDADPDAIMKLMPLADGGEGTAEILGEALRGDKVSVKAVDALDRPITADYYICGDTAIIDVASTVGIALLRRSELDIMRASSRGVGLMMLDAICRGSCRFVIGVGGSACCDGGRGLYEILRETLAIQKLDITVLCDVNNPLYGPQGAAFVFAPQKGATPDQVELLDMSLRQWCDKLLKLTGRNVASLPGAGAAGGIAGMLAAVAGARLVSGIDYVMDALDIDRAISNSSLILTGEGRIDSQTLSGKTLSGVVERARAAGVPVMAFGGSVESTSELHETFNSLIAITPPDMPLETALLPEIAADNMRLAVADALA